MNHRFVQKVAARYSVVISRYEISVIVGCSYEQKK
jgi:hypothetical protein